MKFPVSKGHNLNRQMVTLPDDLGGKQNILLIAFQRWQQSQVDSWIPFVRQLEQNHAGLKYYELPTIEQLNPLMRVFINEGMRAGIPDALARERTITLYLDKVTYCKTLNITNEDDIIVLLTDKQGEIVWRTEGVLTHEKASALENALYE